VAADRPAGDVRELDAVEAAVIALFGRLDRHLLKRTAVTVLMVAVLMMVVTLAIDFLVNMGAYLHGKQGGHASLVVELYWYRLPQLANLALPIGMVLASLIVAAPMLKRGEFVALCASGVAPGRVGLMLPLVALAVGCLDAYIADRVTPHAVVATTRIQDEMENNNRMGRVWQVQSTGASWFIKSAGGLINAHPPVVERVIIAARDRMVTAESMSWDGARWRLRGSQLQMVVANDGTVRFERKDDIALTGQLALPYTPEELYAHLLPRDTMSTGELIRRGDPSDISYAWSRWLRTVVPLLSVLAALPVFVRFLHKDQLILGAARALAAAAAPVALVVAGALTAEHGRSESILVATVLLALAPCLVSYWRWRL
jgi:lipopolysaccharide export LptBFGC system permease protein LptF